MIGKYRNAQVLVNLICMQNMDCIKIKQNILVKDMTRLFREYTAYETEA